ncbi:MAG: hypothetical protein D6731_00065 [Planctomycetota bacterium]|nr:MAG: hypothetical protein D6731_00065 [Planctomycetota bacterium]
MIPAGEGSRRSGSASAEPEAARAPKGEATGARGSFATGPGEGENVRGRCSPVGHDADDSAAEETPRHGGAATPEDGVAPGRGPDSRAAEERREGAARKPERGEDSFAEDPFAEDPFAEDPFAEDPFAEECGEGAARTSSRAEDTAAQEDAAEEDAAGEESGEGAAVGVGAKVGGRRGAGQRVLLPPPALVVADGSSGSASAAAGIPALARGATASRVRWAALLGASLVAATAWGGWFFLEGLRADAEVGEFLRLARKQDPDAALAAYGTLSPAAREDPRVEGLRAKLQEGLARERARREARRRYEAAEALADRPAEARAACEAALAADSSFAPAYVLRAWLRARAARARPGEAQAARVVLRDAFADLDAARRAAPADSAAELVRGVLLFDAGDREGASRAFAEAGGSPGPESALARAWRRLLGGEFERAAGDFERCAERAAGWRRSLALRGAAVAALALGRRALARAFARRLAREDPGSPAAPLALAECADDPRAARAHLAEALRRDPLCARAHALLAEVLAAAEPGRARQAARRALALDPACALGHRVLAELAEEEGAREEALERARAAARAAWRPRERVRALALALRVARALGRPAPERAELAEELLRVAPDSVPALVERAAARAAAGRTREARADLERALRLGSTPPPDALFLHAQLLWALRPCPLPEVLAALGRLLDLAPEHQEARLLRARALLRAERPREALSDLERVHGVAPETVELLRADARFALGEWAAARRGYEAYLRLRPDSPEAARARERSALCARRLRRSAADF